MNYILKLKMPSFDYSDGIIVIIYVNNIKNIHRLRCVKFLLSLSASESAFAASSSILLSSKIWTK